MIPKLLEKQVVQWYQNALYHPEEIRTDLSIAQHFYWKDLRKTAHEVCSKCKVYQFLKRKKNMESYHLMKQKVNLGTYYA